MRYVQKLLVSVALLVLTLSAQAATGVFPKSTFDNLDYGLYWFGFGDSWQKAVPGQSNAYYSNTKPTIIYIHGWQNGATARQSRETFNRLDAGGPDLDLANSWLNAGYNVGILYWNQFADEGEVKDAEAKIWTASGPKAMRWRNSAGSYSNGPSKSAADLLFDSYKANLAGYSGSNIRIAGHSLGNQMAIVLTKKISDAVSAGTVSSKLLPKRVALLDPFYSNYAKSYLGNKWVGEVCRTYVSELKTKGVIFEAYRTSAATSTVFVGDANTGLLKMTAFTELKPWYFQAWQQAEKHNAAVWHYLWSHSFNAPAISGSSLLGASAKTTDSRIKDLMNGTKKLVHDLGAYSKEPSDDTFKLQNR